MNLLALLFGCSHRNLSRVWTLRPIKRARNNWPEQRGNARTYRVCLDCAREIPYTGELVPQQSELAAEILQEREA
jgi:hypothetical protein